MLVGESREPRYERSPTGDAETTFHVLYALYVGSLPRRSQADWHQLVESVWVSSRVESRGDYLLRKQRQHQDRAWDEEKVEAYIAVGLGFCIDVMNAASTERDLARSYAADASKYAVMVAAFFLSKAKTSADASKAAGVRHAENRAMRRDAISWYRANRASGITKDAAAELIAKHVVPAKFRTVRDWLSREKD